MARGKAGSVSVDLEGNASGFTAAVNSVNRSLDGLGAKASGLDRSFRSALSILGGGFVVGAGIRAIVQNTGEAQQAAVLLENSLRQAGAASKSTAEEFLAYATQLQRSTTFSDEAIANVESLLVGFRGLSEGTIKRATADVLDLSTRLGVDLTAGAKLVGKALEDPVKGMTALRRAGVLFSDAQEGQIKAFIQTGDLASAQGVVLRELESRFQGAATAARNTMGGALAGLKNDFSDLLEARSGLPGAVSAINELSSVLQDPATVQAADALTGALVTGFGSAATFIANTAGAVRFLAEEFAALRHGAAAGDIVRLQDQLALLENMRSSGPLSRVRFFGKDGLVEFYDDAELDQEMARLRSQIESSLSSAGSAASQVTGGDFTTRGAEGATTASAGLTDRQLQALDNVAKLKIENVRRILAQAEEEVKAFGADPAILAMQQNFELQMSLEAQLTEGIAAENEKRLELVTASLDAQVAREQRAQEQMIAFREAGFNAAQSLMTAYGGKYKALATAILAVEKAQAIHQVFIDTKAAVMRTFAKYGATPLGYAGAAAMVVLGAAQAAAIASSVIGGGSNSAALGSPHNPVFTDDGSTGTSSAAQGASEQTVVQVIVQGNLYGNEQAIDQLIDGIQDRIENRDVVLISSSSRNAAEIRG